MTKYEVDQKCVSAVHLYDIFQCTELIEVVIEVQVEVRRNN